jgi:hypothetical protein
LARTSRSCESGYAVAAVRSEFRGNGGDERRDAESRPGCAQNGGDDRRAKNQTAQSGSGFLVFALTAGVEAFLLAQAILQVPIAGH